MIRSVNAVTASPSVARSRFSSAAIASAAPSTASSRPISDLADDLLRYAVPRHTYTDAIALLLLRNR
ncbi:hypothetical protein RI578_39035 [Streptomyces sp. BB1-1-1]|uniref:hypothetical protein n=1 Tax=Streptomyces sp. BB1-1-1 TaxID=3074430 RepID=UPI0028777A52|nr:hypothetical protein [Streptomyces sp. BB1-1-1]WND39920.1 hypothetical protein RI578_39035 [Streptomyces sp. BB1-1-1]